MVNMKLAIAILLFVVSAVWAVGLTEEEKQTLLSYTLACVVQSGVDTNLVANATKGEFPDDPKMKEHVFCVMKKIGFLNDAGEIQEQVLKTMATAALGEADAQKLISECAVKKATPQDTAYEGLKCYYSKIAAVIPIILV